MLCIIYKLFLFLPPSLIVIVSPSFCYTSVYNIWHQDEKDGGTGLANDAISGDSGQQVEIDGDLQLIEDAISSRSSDEGVEHEKQTITEEGIKIESGAELHHEARSTCNCDGGGATFENKSTLGQKVKTEGGAELNDEAGGIDSETRSSRSFAQTLHFWIVCFSCVCYLMCIS